MKTHHQQDFQPLNNEWILSSHPVAMSTFIQYSPAGIPKTQTKFTSLC